MLYNRNERKRHELESKCGHMGGFGGGKGRGNYVIIYIITSKIEILLKRHRPSHKELYICPIIILFFLDHHLVDKAGYLLKLGGVRWRFNL